FDLLGEDSVYPSAFVANEEIMVTLWRVTDPKKAVEFDRKNNVGLHHLAFSIANFDALDALHEALLSTPGVVIEFSPELLGAGPTKHMMIREPSGNRLEFIHRPPR
ncbi:MAG: lactoylglutathione lyase, partial [Kiritimatiellia bacterium]